MEHKHRSRLVRIARDGGITARQFVRGQGPLNFLVGGSRSTSRSRGVDLGSRDNRLRHQYSWQTDRDSESAGEDSCRTSYSHRVVYCHLTPKLSCERSSNRERSEHQHTARRLQRQLGRVAPPWRVVGDRTTKQNSPLEAVTLRRGE